MTPWRNTVLRSGGPGFFGETLVMVSVWNRTCPPQPTSRAASKSNSLRFSRGSAADTPRVCILWHKVWRYETSFDNALFGGSGQPHFFALKHCFSFLRPCGLSTHWLPVMHSPLPLRSPGPSACPDSSPVSGSFLSSPGIAAAGGREKMSLSLVFGGEKNQARALGFQLRMSSVFFLFPTLSFSVAALRPSFLLWSTLTISLLKAVMACVSRSISF